MRSEYKYWISIPTRWSDMDPMNHVNSATYFSYFEIARMSYFDTIGLMEYKVQGEVGPAVVSQTCNYRQQLFHPSVLDAGIRTTELRDKTFSVCYEFYLENTDTLICDGSTVIAWVDYSVPKAAPIPEALREKILAFDSLSV